MPHEDPIVKLIGKEPFQWLSQKFNSKTTLKDIPDEILARIGSVDITTRNYAGDPNSVTCIAVITFAYKMADRVQEAPFGVKDILLLKVLAKEEKLRRKEKNRPGDGLWDAPLFELLTGKVGDRIRATRTMNSPI
ncbi:MAG: hypothetical protein JRF53_10485 [Deltaproteobacteria bacterium]|nr:hypothetical protein [Deltaproteobacteria bacterium]MBW2344419.1 hypothetical protein [Deltaproteobacteria bacterium]